MIFQPCQEMKVLFMHDRKKLSLGFLFLASPLLTLSALQAQTQIEPPRITKMSSDHGPAQPSKEFTVTVHLKMHNEDAFDKALQALYTPGSPTWHQWMTAQDLAKYAPTPEEVKTVKNELASHGLSVLSISPDNLSIRARGTVASMEDAFQTQIHEFEREGKVFHANATSAKLTGIAGNFIKSVSGLSSFPLRPMIQHPVDPITGKKLPTIPLADVPVGGGGLGAHFSNNCFPGPASLDLTMLSGASLPVGQYYGNIYKSEALGRNHICAWTPAQVQAHYGLTSAYNKGIDGTGQTIVIVDGPSDPTVKDDLTQFAQLTGLPAITSSNFQIIYPDGQPSQWELSSVANWDEEADLDIEWAHAIAPKAKIVLLITPTQDWSELEYAIQYAQEHKLGKVISNSYGYPEMAWGAHTLEGFDQVLKLADAQGIAVNFASGDYGDMGTGSPSGGGTEFPASSQYVTAIGGTSIGIPDGSSNGAEIAWGHNAVVIANGYGVLDPPILHGFASGSGGGTSGSIAKPSWQKSLSGSYRQVPDISALADPYTGAITVIGGQAGAIGGTSLACPIFSAIWALADQKAGRPLGQAAPLIAKLPSGAVKDIVSFSSPTNPAGIVFDSTGATYYSSDVLLAPLYTTTAYYSALWFDQNIPGYVILSFGTDSSLTVTPGWDNITGWGVPNGWTFITAAAAKK
jgi:subtilase family serine protease